MCGIAGALDLGAGPGVLDTVDPMTACLYHRGPDEDGLLPRRRVALGSRRLSIVDIAGSTQPIANEDETVWVVFNGQIYNYVELRADLEKRHTFRTQGDTETLAPPLRGARAGLRQEAARHVRVRHLGHAPARAAAGARPLRQEAALLRAPGDDRFLFASEIKALLADTARSSTPSTRPRSTSTSASASCRTRARPTGDRGCPAGATGSRSTPTAGRRSSATGSCRAERTFKGSRQRRARADPRPSSTSPSASACAATCRSASSSPAASTAGW